jgi:hypothetical protein
MSRRSWVRLGGAGGRTICCTLPSSNCFRAALTARPGEGDLEEAVGEINRILERVAKDNPDPTRELAILAVPTEAGEDELLLDWVAVDVEVTTPFDVHQ